MPSEIELRRNELNEARRVIAARTADHLAALAAAPAWFRPDVEISSLAAANRPLAEELKKRYATLESDRSVLEEIDREVELLGSNPNRLQLCVRRTLKWINGAETWKDLVNTFRPDPANHLRPDSLRRRRLSKAIAEGILAVRDAQPGHKLTNLRDLLNVPGVDAALLRDLVYTGCQLIPPAPQPFRPTLGVMLPVRMETRFYAPGAAGLSWKLRLRIVPDHASIDRHDPRPNAMELDDVERMWQQAGGNLTTDKGKAAWGAFMSVHRGHRAAWLARTFQPQPADDNGVIHIVRPAQVAQESRLSMLRGLPARLEVWQARGGGSPTLAATLAVDPLAASLDLPLNLDDNTPQKWWNSYHIAEELHLAVEIDLGPGDPSDIDVLYVTGLSQETPDTLFQAHRDAGQLAVLAPGTPTNTVDGQPAVDLGSDPEYWRQMVLKAAAGEPGTEQVSQAVTGRTDALGPLPGGASSPRDLNLWLVQGLWPALWGHAFKNVWGLGGAVTPVGLWAGENLLPEGYMPSIRIGNQPYGMLLATTLAHWQAATGDPPFEEQLRPYLSRLRQAWAKAARTHGTVAGADTEKLLDLIGQVPSSQAYAYRQFISLEYLFALLGGFDQTISMQDLDAMWRQIMGEELAYPLIPQRRYVSVGWLQDIQIPLVEPDNLPETVSFKDALWSLTNASPAALASGSYLKEMFKGQLPNSLLFRLLVYSLVVAAAEVTRAQNNIHAPILEPITAPEGSRYGLSSARSQFA
jgi:hypothetical protein